MYRFKNACGKQGCALIGLALPGEWYFGMKAHTGVDAESGLVHAVRGTSGNISYIAEANSLLYVQESAAFGDAGCQGVEKPPDATKEVTWHVAMRPGKRRALNKEIAADAMIEKVEKFKAVIRAKVEHPIRVVKRQFGHVWVRDHGLEKNTAQLVMLFALSKLWMARGELMGSGVSVRPKTGTTPCRALRPLKTAKKPSDFRDFFVKFNDLKRTTCFANW